MTYRIMPLPYGLKTLEPVIDARTVELHHGVHALARVDGLNEALDSFRLARDGGGIPEPTRRRMRLALAQAVAYNASGMLLHQFYFANLCAPGQGGRPSQALHERIVADYGSPGIFTEEFSDIANSVQGSGWAVFVWSPELKRSFILAIDQHQNGWIPNTVVLLAVDVWEHAYYLKYNAKRSDYVKALWGIINWNVVNARYAHARGNEQ